MGASLLTSVVAFRFNVMLFACVIIIAIHRYYIFCLCIICSAVGVPYCGLICTVIMAGNVLVQFGPCVRCSCIRAIYSSTPCSIIVVINRLAQIRPGVGRSGLCTSFIVGNASPSCPFNLYPVSVTYYTSATMGQNCPLSDHSWRNRENSISIISLTTLQGRPILGRVALRLKSSGKIWSRTQKQISQSVYVI